MEIAKSQEDAGQALKGMIQKANEEASKAEVLRKMQLQNDVQQIEVLNTI